MFIVFCLDEHGIMFHKNACSQLRLLTYKSGYNWTQLIWSLPTISENLFSKSKLPLIKLFLGEQINLLVVAIFQRLYDKSGPDFCAN